MPLVKKDNYAVKSYGIVRYEMPIRKERNAKNADEIKQLSIAHQKRNPPSWSMEGFSKFRTT